MMLHLTKSILQVLKAVLMVRAEEMALEAAKTAQEEKAKMAKEAQT